MILKGFIKHSSKCMLTLFISSVVFMIYYTYSGNSNLIGTSGSSQFKKSKMNIAILIPTTTRNVKSPKLDELSLMTFCLPSIVDTMESVYTYTVYIGIDKGDYLRTVQDYIVHKFPFVKSVLVEGDTFAQAVNEIANVAYKDNITYFVRINDDTKFVTKNWE